MWIIFLLLVVIIVLLCLLLMLMFLLFLLLKWLMSELWVGYVSEIVLLVVLVGVLDDVVGGGVIGVELIGCVFVLVG